MKTIEMPVYDEAKLPTCAELSTSAGEGWGVQCKPIAAVGKVDAIRPGSLYWLAYPVQPGRDYETCYYDSEGKEIPGAIRITPDGKHEEMSLFRMQLWYYERDAAEKRARTALMVFVRSSGDFLALEINKQASRLKAAGDSRPLDEIAAELCVFATSNVQAVIMKRLAKMR
jgi:hypothetical protein